MKKLISLFIVSIFSFTVFAQIDTNRIKAGWAALDYAVPESPAFKMLGVTPDNILQPTSVKSIVLNVGNYYANNGSVLPKNLAVEISPLLLNQKASLNAYNKNKFLFRARLSLGTSISNSGTHNIAEGLRFTIIDKTDLRTNKQALDYFYTHAQDISNRIDAYLAQYAATHPGECETIIECKERFATDSNFKRAVLSSFRSNFDSIASFRENMREKLWNAEIMEVGIGAVQTTPDSLLSNNISVYRAGLRMTYGNHFSKNDQILFGGKLQYVDSLTGSFLSTSLGARYYYGSNETRGFVQFEYCYDGGFTTAIGSAGCIFRITNGLWGNFALSFVLDENNKLSYKPSFNLNFGTPEKKK